MIRARYSLKVALSSSADEARDLANGSHEAVDDTIPEGGSVKVRIAADSGPIPLVVSSVGTIQLVVLRAHAVNPTQTPVPLEIRFGSTSADPVMLQPVGRQTEAVLMLTTETSSVYVTNPGAVPMYVLAHFAGE